MKTFRILIALFLFLLPVRICGQQQNYTGTYQVTTGDITLTLTIKKDESNMVTGTLKSSNGSQFTLEGMLNEGIAAGICTGNEGSLYFEAYLDGNDLTFSLIEPDQFNMPDYETAEYFVLSRSGQHPIQTPPPTGSQPSPREQITTIQPEKQGSNLNPGTEVVKDDINGYSFTKPDGWVHQQGDGKILLGSNTIAGLISVFPHQAQNIQELHGLMNQGIQES